MPDAPTRTWRRRALRWAITIVVGVFAWFAVQRLIGRIDWPAVGAAFGDMPGWAFAPLLAFLLLRQLLNSVPLTYYVPGLGLRRSFLNDTTANLAATIAPSPSDIALRVAMFRSWGLDPVAGMTGATLNTAKFYAIRFVAPLIGLALVGAGEAGARRWATALACGAVAVVLLVGLVLLLRSDATAARIGRLAARLVRRVRRDVDEQVWADYLVGLRETTADSLRRGLLPSMVALVGMVLADATILLVAVRALGVPAADLPLLEVWGALLLLYPLTVLPLVGLGVLDALLVGALVGVGGELYEADLVAAVIVGRATTILGTLLLGLVSLGWWRLTTRPRAVDP